MNCPHCNAQLPTGLQYCPSCGASLTTYTPPPTYAQPNLSLQSNQQQPLQGKSIVALGIASLSIGVLLLAYCLVVAILAWQDMRAHQGAGYHNFVYVFSVFLLPIQPIVWHGFSGALLIAAGALAIKRRSLLLILFIWYLSMAFTSIPVLLFTVFAIANNLHFIFLLSSFLSVPVQLPAVIIPFAFNIIALIVLFKIRKEIRIKS